MELVILGLIVLFAYLFIRADGEIRRLDERRRVIGPIGNWPRGTMGGTRAGAFPTHRPSASTTTGRRFAWAWRPRSPANRGQIPRTRVVARFPSGDSVSAGAGARQPARPAPAPQGHPACQARRPGIRPRLRRPGQRSGNGPRFPGPARARGGHQPATGGPCRRNAGVDQSRAHARPDRPQPGPEHRGTDLGGPEGLGSPRRTDRGSLAADHPRDRHRRLSPARPDEDEGPPICKVCGEPIAEARSSVPSAIRLITAIAGSTSAPVRSMAAMARSVSGG